MGFALPVSQMHGWLQGWHAFFLYPTDEYSTSFWSEDEKKNEGLTGAHT